MFENNLLHKVCRTHRVESERNGTESNGREWSGKINNINFNETLYIS